MGTCYTLMLYDDFDWNYRPDVCKDDTIDNFSREFEELFDFKPTLKAYWPHFIIFDTHKKSPEQYKKMLFKYCDIAYVYDDHDALIRRIEPDPPFVPNGAVHKEMIRIGKQK